MGWRRIQLEIRLEELKQQLLDMDNSKEHEFIWHELIETEDELDKIVDQRGIVVNEDYSNFYTATVHIEKKQFLIHLFKTHILFVLGSNPDQ